MAQVAAPATNRSGSNMWHLPGIARLAAALEAFIGVGAIFGGGLLILAPDGHLLGVPPSMLAGTPFASFLIPGILLFTAIGLIQITAAVMTLRRVASAPLAAVAAGLILVGWISGEMVIFGGLQTLAWAFYLVLGTVVAAVGVIWARSHVSETPSSFLTGAEVTPG